MAKKIVETQTDGQESAVNYRWHLAQSGAEVDTTELEFALMRTFEGFGRWQSECLASVVDLAATGPENAMLHIIRMNERPKSIKELAGMVIRKGAGRSGVTYEVTERWRQVTDDYGAVRRRLLIAQIEDLPGFSARLADATRTLNLLSGIYEEAARVAATHRRG